MELPWGVNNIGTTTLGVFQSHPSVVLGNHLYDVQYTPSKCFFESIGELSYTLMKCIRVILCTHEVYRRGILYTHEVYKSYPIHS